MKKQDILFLVNVSGILHASAHELGPAHAYKFFQLKKAIEKIYKNIEKETEDIFKEAGLDDSTQQKLTDIAKKQENRIPLSIDDRDLLMATRDVQNKANKLLKEMHASEVKDADLENVKSLPYEVWRELQKENRAKTINDKVVDVLGGQAEIILEGLFWKSPEHEDSKKEEKPEKSKSKK